MRGVVAAPEGLAGPEWVELFDPQPDAELTKALTAWREEMAKADDGLHASPAPAERLASLRAELKRRGPRRLRRAARRRAPGRIRAAPLAAAGLADRLHRLGRPGDRAGRQGGDLRRRPLHAAGARAGRHRRLRAAPDPGGIAGRPGSPRTCRRAASSASIPGCRRSTATTASRAPRSAPAAASCRSTPTRSTRCGRDRPAPPLAPVLPQPVEFAGETSEQARRASPTSSPPRAPTWRCSPRPIRSPGCSTSAAATCRARRSPLGFALLHADGHVDLFMDRRKVPAAPLAWLGNAVTLAPPDELGAGARHAGQGRQARAGRDRDRAGLGGDAPAGGRRHDRARRRSGGAAQGLQERRSRSRAPRRPSPRRRGGDAASSPGWRRESQSGKLREIEVVRPAGGASARRPAQLRDLSLRHHLRRRPQRRHRPLPRHAGDQAHARARRALSRRFRRPVPRRHHRHHPHRGDRHADAGDAATASPACSRATSRSPRARFPAGTTGSQLDALARTRAVAGRARLRPRHRPRRRLLSRRCTRGRSASPRSANTRRRCSPA